MSKSDYPRWQGSNAPQTSDLSTIMSELFQFDNNDRKILPINSCADWECWLECRDKYLYSPTSEPAYNADNIQLFPHKQSQAC